MGDNINEGENDEDLFHLNPEDILDVIELNNDDDVADNEEDDEDVMEEGAGLVSEDDSNIVFAEHSDCVFCVRIDPMTSSFAVTGGQDDRAIVWDVKSGEKLFECAGHKDSVTTVGFSHDGALVATGDLGGLIQVWDMATKAVVWSFECGDVEWLEWHQGAHVLFAGTVDGDTWMWKIPSGETKTFNGHGPPANSGVICPDGKRACVGYKDGVVKVWDLKAGVCSHTFSGHEAHTSSVVSLDCYHDNTLVISGSTDNTAKLLNSVSGKVIATLKCKRNPGSQAEDESVETVGLSRVMPWAATGNLAGELEIWDLSTHIVRQHCHHEDGIVKLKWDRESPMVYTACLDGCLRLWDSRSGDEVSKWRGHSAEILDFDISLDGNTVVTASEDSTARVFSIHAPDR